MPNKGVPWKQAMWRMSNGKSVMSFCKENNVHYSCVMFHIDTGHSVDEACEIALSRKGKFDGATKYWIDDKPLIQWCKENNENYFKFRNEILKREKEQCVV